MFDPSTCSGFPPHTSNKALAYAPMPGCDPQWSPLWRTRAWCVPGEPMVVRRLAGLAADAHPQVRGKAAGYRNASLLRDLRADPVRSVRHEVPAYERGRMGRAGLVPPRPVGAPLRRLPHLRTIILAAVLFFGSNVAQAWGRIDYAFNGSQAEGRAVSIGSAPSDTLVADRPLRLPRGASDGRGRALVEPSMPLGETICSRGGVTVWSRQVQDELQVTFASSHDVGVMVMVDSDEPSARSGDLFTLAAGTRRAVSYRLDDSPSTVVVAIGQHAEHPIRLTTTEQVSVDVGDPEGDC